MSCSSTSNRQQTQLWYNFVSPSRAQHLEEHRSDPMEFRVCDFWSVVLCPHFRTGFGLNVEHYLMHGNSLRFKHYSVRTDTRFGHSYACITGTTCNIIIDSTNQCIRNEHESYSTIPLRWCILFILNHSLFILNHSLRVECQLFIFNYSWFNYSYSIIHTQPFLTSWDWMNI